MAKVYIKTQSLEEILAKKNILKKDFARALGIHETYFNRLLQPEKYGLSPGPLLREKMQRLLGVEFDDIFFIQSVQNSGNFDEKLSITPDNP